MGQTCESKHADRRTLRCPSVTVDLTTPQIMGILNITPDSFHVESRAHSVEKALQQAQAMVAAGATLIDIGGEPTNPSLHPTLSLQEELSRVIPVVRLLSRELSVPLSVDTSKPEVMQATVEAGASMINDVRALREPGALAMAANLNVPVCIMHMAHPHGVPAGAQHAKLYQQGVMAAIESFLYERRHACLEAGIGAEHIIIDPGVGAGNFGKSLTENLTILRELKRLQAFHCPILVGISRKTFIGELLDIPVEQRMPASLAATVMAVQAGADIIRTHDVKETVEAVRMTLAIMNEE